MKEYTLRWCIDSYLSNSIICILTEIGSRREDNFLFTLSLSGGKNPNGYYSVGLTGDGRIPAIDSTIKMFLFRIARSDVFILPPPRPSRQTTSWCYDNIRNPPNVIIQHIQHLHTCAWRRHLKFVTTRIVFTYTHTYFMNVCGEKKKTIIYGMSRFRVHNILRSRVHSRTH